MSEFKGIEKKEIKKIENPSVYPDPMRGAEQSISNQSPYNLELGITLRDYFAAKAMSGYLSASEDVINRGMYIDSDNIAKECYIIANAMLKARSENIL
jgi:hypothetical protein